MAWVRIEDAVTEHRKHLRAGPAACWLWVCGIAYCQRQLSDGFIPEEALTLLGVVKGAGKLATVLVAVGLFERVNGGYLVHDYHDFNDTREQALQRRAEQHAAKVRAGVAGANKRWQNDGSLLSPANGRPVADGNSRAIAPSQSHPIPLKKHASHVEPPKKPADPRVGEFLKWFPEEFKRRRNGAEYLVKHGKHGALVKQMLGATDLERLKQYAQVMLSDKCEDEFIIATDRGIEILSARFSWLSERLAAWEASRKAKQVS